MGKSKKQISSVPTNVERTGETNFVVKHDDGSVFEGKVDKPERFNSFKNLKSYGTSTSMGGFGKKKPLICDVCNKKVHKATIKNSSCICESCI